jgi:hypothetical protein
MTIIPAAVLAMLMCGHYIEMNDCVRKQVDQPLCDCRCIDDSPLYPVLVGLSTRRESSGVLVSVKLHKVVRIVPISVVRGQPVIVHSPNGREVLVHVRPRPVIRRRD